MRNKEEILKSYAGIHGDTSHNYYFLEVLLDIRDKLVEYAGNTTTSYPTKKTSKKDD